MTLMADSPEHESQATPRILLVKRSSLGDIVNALPTLVALRRGFPDAYLAWLVEDRFQDILLGHGCLDEVIPVRRLHLHQIVPLLGELRRMKGLLRARHFDIAVDIQGLLKSSVMCYLSGAPRRLSFDDEHRESNALLTNERVPGDGNMHAVDRYLTMARYLGCPTEPVEYRLPISAAAREWARSSLSPYAQPLSGPLIGLNLGASRPHKRWPLPHFARLADLLHTRLGATVVLIGGAAETGLAAAIAQQAAAPVVDLVGRTTLAQLPALIEGCAVLVSGDTGALHIAVALNTPVVALFGPTLPHLTGPYGRNNVILWSHPDCTCLNRAGCRDYHCMSEITPESTWSAVEQLLTRAPKRSPI